MDKTARVYVKDFKKGHSCNKLCSSYKATCQKFRGAFITSIANTPVFTKAQAVAKLLQLQKQGAREFSIVFAPKRKLDTKLFWKQLLEYHLFAPNTKGQPEITDLDADAYEELDIGRTPTAAAAAMVQSKKVL